MSKCRAVSNYGACDRQRHDRTYPHGTQISGGGDPFTDPALWFVWHGKDKPVGYRVAALTTSDVAAGIRIASRTELVS